MTGFFSKASLAILLSSPMIFTGCSTDDASTGGGGGGTTTGTYDGAVTAAAIDIDNAEAIGTAAGEAIQVADASDSLPISIVVSDNTSTGLTEMDTIFVDAANAALNTSSLPAGVVVPDACTSGSASISTTGTSETTGPVEMTMTYDNCVLDGSGVTATGTFVMHYNNISDPNAGFSFTYNNFTIVDTDGKSTTMSATVECPTGYYSCTYNSDFTGSDGVTHRVSQSNFYGDASYGYNGTATFYHGTYGSVEITAVDITYGSCGAFPDGGTVEFSSTGSSGTITFNADCTVSGTWSNASGSGSF